MSAPADAIPVNGHQADPEGVEPLVGRQQECRRLAAMLDQLGARAARVVEITGEPGIGKSRLLAHLAALARARGVPVVGARGGLFHAVSSALADAGPPGLAVLLDDLHRVDEESIHRLADLMMRPPRGPVLVALAYRPRQAPLALRAALAAGTGVVPIERIIVGPLAELVQ